MSAQPHSSVGVTEVHRHPLAFYVGTGDQNPCPCVDSADAGLAEPPLGFPFPFSLVEGEENKKGDETMVSPAGTEPQPSREAVLESRGYRL